jgi:hypothetical protein
MSFRHSGYTILSGLKMPVIDNPQTLYAVDVGSAKSVTSPNPYTPTDLQDACMILPDFAAPTVNSLQMGRGAPSSRRLSALDGAAGPIEWACL